MRNDDGLRHLGRREAVIAVAVAGLLSTVAWVSAHREERPADSGAVSTTLTSSANPSVTDIDVSDHVSAADVAACSVRSFSADPDDVSVEYAKVQQTSAGEVSVLVLRNRAGALRLCDSFGGTPPAQAPVVRATTKQPVRFLTPGRRSFDCDGTRLAGFAMSEWLSVSDKVDRVELRFVVDGVAGPWFSTSAEGGLVHAHAWLGQQVDDADVRSQARVLDTGGDPVVQHALPTAPRKLPPCSGADVQLG